MKADGAQHSDIWEQSLAWTHLRNLKDLINFKSVKKVNASHERNLHSDMKFHAVLAVKQSYWVSSLN